MTFEVEVDGRLRTISVERLGGGHYRVVLDGTTHEVNASRAGTYGLSLLVDGGSSREVVLAPGVQRGELLVGLEGRTVSVGVNGGRARRGGGDAGLAPGEVSILAPMPGRVVRVLVAPGDDVSAKQGVVVVEAMKMENELRSPKTGRVREVTVTPGTSVEAGRVLVIIE